jgi:two-component sensor histidine kinase
MAAGPTPTVTTANGLAMAVIAASNAPLLLLDESFVVLAASDSFCDSFQLFDTNLIGRPLAQVGDGEWNLRRIESLLTATAAGHAQIAAYEVDLERPGLPSRRLVLNAQKLSYGGEAVLLLLSVSDVTDARISERLKDDLLREKAVLLRELQHRVANSLQIIASVLLQSARGVQSEETRLHLQDAHNRVMSVAALQTQLASSQLGEVALRAYFGDLCRSIGASMIRDHNQIRIDVKTDDTLVSADVSVSLGLIVTELVINALKHAFPEHRHGVISVGYDAHGANWTLSVSDDGVGMPPTGQAVAGLGTSIVEALARQLKAEVRVTEAHPGAKVSVVHSQLWAVEQPDVSAV